MRSRFLERLCISTFEILVDGLNSVCPKKFCTRHFRHTCNGFVTSDLRHGSQLVRAIVLQREKQVFESICNQGRCSPICNRGGYRQGTLSNDSCSLLSHRCSLCTFELREGGQFQMQSYCTYCTVCLYIKYNHEFQLERNKGRDAEYTNHMPKCRTCC